MCSDRTLVVAEAATVESIDEVEGLPAAEEQVLGMEVEEAAAAAAVVVALAVVIAAVAAAAAAAAAVAAVGVVDLEAKVQVDPGHPDLT